MRTVVDLLTPHVLRSEEEYAAAVAEIDRLLDLNPTPFTRDSDRLELLSVLVENYEALHDPIDDSEMTPQDYVEFMLEQKGMERADLGRLMGGRSRVSDFFHGKRELSKSQIAVLRDVLGIPADLLI